MQAHRFREFGFNHKNYGIIPATKIEIEIRMGNFRKIPVGGKPGNYFLIRHQSH